MLRYRQLQSNSGELTFLASKRSRGFLPSRGKKDPLYELYGDGGQLTGQVPAYLLEPSFDDETKRASGFMPVRGRKSDYGAYYQSPVEVMEKRRIQNAFMPVRGRKSFNDDDFVPPPARNSIYMKSKIPKTYVFPFGQ